MKIVHFGKNYPIAYHLRFAQKSWKQKMVFSSNFIYIQLFGFL